MNVVIQAEDRWSIFYFETIERWAEVNMRQHHPGYPCTKPGPKKYTVTSGSRHVDAKLPDWKVGDLGCGLMPDFEVGGLTSLAAPCDVMRALGVAYEEDLYVDLQRLLNKLSRTRWSSEIPPDLLGKPGNGYWWGMGPPWGGDHPRAILYGQEADE